MKGVTLVLVLTAELVLCNEHGLREPQSLYQQALSVNNAYILGRKYEVLNSVVVAGDLAGLPPNTPEDYYKYSQSKSLNKMRISAFEQIHYRFPTPGTQAPDSGPKPGLGRRGETNKVVAFWDGVRHETQFTIDMLMKFKSPDTELADSITLATKRRVEASKQFVAALLFGNYDERPRIWKYTDEACSKVIKYAKDAEYTKSIKLGFIALIKEHRYAKELVSKMSFEQLPPLQLLYVYGMLCEVEKEKEISDSALSIGLAEAPSISSSGWADILKLLASHAPRIYERCDGWYVIGHLLNDGTDHHLIDEVLKVFKECIGKTAGTSVKIHGSAKAPSSHSGSPATSRRSNLSAIIVSPRRSASFAN